MMDTSMRRSRQRLSPLNRPLEYDVAMDHDDVLEANRSAFERNFKIQDLSGADILRFLAASEVEATWIRAFQDGKVWALVAKAKSKPLVEGLGLNREFLILISSFDDFQPRTLSLRQAVDSSLQTPGRLDNITIVVSSDPVLRDILPKLEDPRQILLGIAPSEVLSALQGGHPSERFRQFLQERLYARDFFDRSGPVYGADFFGREKTLQDVAVQLKRGSHVGLYGLRKVGKTSIINALRERQATLIPEAHFVHLDLLSVTPANRNYRFLYFLIATELKKLGLPATSVPSNGRFDAIADLNAFERGFDADLREGLAKLRERGQRLVLILDEIERLFPALDVRTGFDGYDAFLEYVRGLSQSAGPLSLMVVGVNPHVSEAELLGNRQNPMFGFFVTRYAPPMSAEEVNEMVKTLGRSSGAHFDHEAITLMHSYLGGHPFLIRRYCSLVIKDRTRPAQISPTDIENNRERFLRQETSLFAEMVSVVKDFYPEEFSALHRIATGDHLNASHFNRRIVAHLEGYQLVEESGGKLEMRYRLMKDWMLGVSRRVASEVSKPLVSFGSERDDAGPNTIDHELIADTIKELELSLRGKIRQVLEERYAGKADQRVELAIGADALTMAQERLARSLRFRPASDSSTSEILEFLYIGDLERIICGNEWQHFREIFGDKKETQRNLQIAAGCRTEVQHFRTLPRRECAKAWVAASELLDKVGNDG